MESPTSPVHMADHGVGRTIYILKLLGVAVLYALLAKIVLTFFSANGVVSIVWPPSGLALAMLLIGGKRYFPGVFLGAFLANAMTGLALGVAAAIAMGNTLEALLGAWLLTRDGRFDSDLRTLGDYLRLIVLGGFVACSVAALNGSTTLLASGFITAEAYFHNLLYWWMGDALGIIIVAPLILAWRRIPDGWLEPKRMAEAILLFALAFLAGQIVFLGWFQGTDVLFKEVAKGYWIFLFVSWLAVRLGTGAVVIALVMVAIQALFGAALGVGFFANDIARTGLINYWFYIITLSVVGMALAIHFSEHKQLERQLSRRLRHRDAMERITRISLNSTNIEELLGKVLDEILIVFDADRAWFLYPCDPDAPSWSVPMERTRPGWPGASARGTAIPMTPEVAEVFREVLASAKPLPYGPAASRGIPAAVAGQFSIRSQIQMALRPRTGSPWTMGLHHCAQAHTYDEDDLLLFNDIGQRVADALSSMTILKNLRASEENLNRAQTVGQIGSWLLDIPTNRLEWSAETYRMFGIPQQQAIDLEAFVATVHPDDRDFVLKAWSEALAGAPYDIEHRIVVGGQERWVRERALIERDAEGHPLVGIGTVQDITERKHLEQEREQYFRFFLLSTDPMCIADPFGCFKQVNPTFTQLTGFSESELVTKPFLDFVLPEDRQRTADEMKLQVMTRPSMNFENRYVCKDGRVILLSWAGYFDKNDGVTYATARDITERKQAEEKLRASEQKFMRLFMEIPIPLGVADKEGIIAYFNNKFTEVFGYTVDDVPTLNEWWLKAYPDETYRRWVLDNWSDAVAKAAKEGKSVESAEYRVTCKNGAERIVIIGGSPVASGVLAIFNDITERKRSEETLLSMTKTLRASQQLLDSIVEHIPVMVFVKSASDLRFELFNRAGEELLGYSRSDLLGKGDYDFWPKEQGDWFTAADRKVLASEGITEIPEEPIQTASGETRYLHTWKVALRDENGEPTHLLGISVDITERKQAEELLRINQTRFSTIFNQAPSGIALIDSFTGKFYEVNPRYAEIAGRTIEELTAIDWMSITHPDDLQEDLDNMALLNAGKIPGFRMDKRYLRPDGSIVWINMTIAPLRGEKDISPRHLAMIDDITERKEYEEELKRSNVDLEQFSYAVSHDMRQPLRMISSYLQLLERSMAGQLDSEKRNYFNVAIEGAKRIDQMLVELLEYSRIGRMGEPPTWIDSRAALDEALQFLQPAIAEAQARLDISGDWPRIFANGDEILRLLQNLIGNAVKFRVAGRAPEIAVTSEMVKNEWHLCVADNGVGIIPEQTNRLFKVFQRLQSREAYEGTGIGLALCRKIAEHHKGRIWVESAGEGQGSKFYVVLPVLLDEKHLQ
ncbi:MAG: PAS domain S-box protein [Gallionella sp.]|nr:PAS domain S-box protein [Gallionella sp.]